MHESDEKQVNVGAVPPEVAKEIDDSFHRLCVLLRKHGREIIPKKMLFSSAIYYYLNPLLSLDRKESEQEAIEELIGNVEKFWKRDL